MEFLPVFPLNIVVFPGNPTNLHIFEPRYKYLIKECVANKFTFGIPFVKDNQVLEFGTEIEVVEIVKTYENGNMDIRTKAKRIFKIMEVIKSVPDRPYMGAVVAWQKSDHNPDERIRPKIEMLFNRFYEVLNLKPKKEPDFENRDWSVYEIANQVGLSQEQEYQLLQYEQEVERQQYIYHHLIEIIRITEQTEALKEKIKLNGHFQNLKPPF